MSGSQSFQLPQQSSCLVTRTDMSCAAAWMSFRQTETAEWDLQGDTAAASLDPRRHHKSKWGHLDVWAVWRLVLTSTKGPQSEPEKVWPCSENKEQPLYSSVSVLFQHSSSLFFSLPSVISLALQSTAGGGAEVNYSLIWICSLCECVRVCVYVCDEPDFSLVVSVETLGGKQPAPACPSWDTGVSQFCSGEL